MMGEHKLVFIHADAPAKPRLGAPCNGCGVCCLVEPCPLGVVLSRRRTGACVALQWQASSASYRCGAMIQPREALRRALPAGLHIFLTPFIGLLRSSAKRWISAGSGCDCSLKVEAQVLSDPGAPG